MFYVKNDDMDDMFKKAAEHYEINDDLAADWNKVHAALQDDDTAIVAPEKEKKRRRFIFFWWLLLIPAALLVAYSVGWLEGKTSGSEQKFASTKKEDTSIIKKQNEQINSNTDNNNQANTEAATATIQQQKNYSFITAPGDSRSALPIAQTNINQQQPVNGNSIQTTGEVNNHSNNISLYGNNEPSKESPGAEGTFMDTTSILFPKNNSALSNENDTESSTDQQAEKKQNAANKKERQPYNNYTRQAYFFGGITTNLDLSFVKNQHTSKIGYGAGIVGGYHLKNGLSIQTGLLYDKKNYYTAGEYFDTKRLHYFQTSGATLNYANGNCNMWEIPINISYDFKTRKKYNWFVSAGVSSYLMHNEYYDFNYAVNGNVYDKGYNYPHSTKDYFAVMNLGAGANIQAGKKIFIQAQPYLKVPLSGIGLGNLSLKSTGLNLSVVRRIH